MNISCRKIQALCIPHKNNDLHAVIEVCLTSPSGQTVCAVGEAQGKNESEVKGLLQQAEENAHSRALAMLEACNFKDYDDRSVYQKWSDDSPLSNKNILKNIPSVKNAGGGNNPASPKQRELIKKLCHDNKIDVDIHVNEKFDTELRNLIGSQADQIIKELTKKKS